MYNKDFYITDPVGNNAFSHSQRRNKRLFIPKLKKIESFDEIHLRDKNLEKITFEEFDFDGNMQTCYGLENLYALSLKFPTHCLSPTLSCHEREQSTKNTPLYLVDNHNHVFYFWYLARQQGIISDNSLLYHIDEHADTRDPGEYLLKPESLDLKMVFKYTNFTLNVGNYIIPAEQEGLIGKTIQIRGESALKEYISGQPQEIATTSSCRGVTSEYPSLILNLDLDFFEPELDFIDYNLKKQVILDIARKADIITVCTSPYFINQQRALEVFRDIFTEGEN